MLNGQLWAGEGVNPSQQDEMVGMSPGMLPSAAA